MSSQTGERHETNFLDVQQQQSRPALTSQGAAALINVAEQLVGIVVFESLQFFGFRCHLP